jgi:hypothetical protein
LECRTAVADGGNFYPLFTEVTIPHRKQLLPRSAADRKKREERFWMSVPDFASRVNPRLETLWARAVLNDLLDI